MSIAKTLPEEILKKSLEKVRMAHFISSDVISTAQLLLDPR